jgi:hypothetical protein
MNRSHGDIRHKRQGPLVHTLAAALVAGQPPDPFN